MQWLNNFMEKFYVFTEKVRPGFQAAGKFFRSLGSSLYTIGLYMYRMRSIILAAPLAAATAILAFLNMGRLPETVEITKIAINTKADDALFGFLALTPGQISRYTAVLGPVFITSACIVMMLCSKRTLFPFIIALFSLCLPMAIYFFNVYPM